jgi:hypothetical protein
MMALGGLSFAQSPPGAPGAPAVLMINSIPFGEMNGMTGGGFQVIWNDKNPI